MQTVLITMHFVKLEPALSGYDRPGPRPRFKLRIRLTLYYTVFGKHDCETVFYAVLDL